MGSSRSGAGAYTPGLASLSPEKRALLEQRLKRRSSVTPQATSLIPPREPSAARVMSSAQRRLFLLDQAFPGMTAYNVVQIVRVDGHLDVPALRRSLDEITRRHEVLRTRISVDASGDRLEVFDAAADFLATDAPTVADAERLARAEVSGRFDLSRDTLLRARLFSVDSEQHVLMLATHHIASDAVSKLVINRELSELYQSFAAGKAMTMAPPTLQYADYAAWLTTAGSVQYADSLRWWREHLRDAPDETALPFDRSRPPRPTFAGETLGVSLGAQCRRDIDSFARQHKVTPFMVLLAGYAAMLESRCGQGDLVIGSPTSGRHHEQLSDVIGLFLNTLPLRIDTSGNPSFRTLLARVKATAANGFRHQAVPFEEIVEAARPVRDMSRNPLYQATFTLRNSTGPGLQLEGLAVEALPFQGGWSKLDLGLVCHPEKDGGLRLLWQYSSDLFDRATVQAMADQLVQLYAEVVEQPDLPMNELASMNTGHAERGTDVNTALPATPRDVGLLPLSAGQQRLRVLDELIDDPAAVTVTCSYRVNGAVAAEPLQRSLNQLVARHDALRTTVISGSDVLAQRISSTGHWPLAITDVRSTDDPPASAARLVAAERPARFDLAHGPLVAAHLILAGDDDSRLVLSGHRTVVDQASMDVLLDELSAIYGAMLVDEPALLAPPVAQFPDISAWQESVLSSSTGQAQLAYWRGQLAGAPPTLDLPTDHSRPPVATYDGARHTVELGIDLAGTVDAMAVAHGTGDFVVLAAACAAVLHRLSNQSDFVIGRPDTGRSDPAIATVVGPLATSQVLRADVDGDPTFAEFVDRMRRVAGRAQDSGDVPFERLVTELRPDRDVSRNPLFQVSVDTRLDDSTPRTLGPLILEPDPAAPCVVHCDVAISFVSHASGLRLEVDYRTDLFDVGSVAGLADRVVGVLVAGVGQPWLRLSELPVLVGGERAGLLGWGGVVGDGVGVVAPELIAGWVGRCPDRVAVCGPDAELTYGQLWEWSGWWARRVAEVAAPGSRVAIGMQRSAMLVVAALAVWRAGCAYVPVDPSFPRQRLELMVDDADVAVVLTDAVSVSLLPAGDRPVLVIDAAGPGAGVGVGVDGLAAQVAARSWSGDDPAYVIYTSGSTGTPKGVVVGHGALGNLLESMRAEPGLGEADTLVSVTTFSFDIAALELFLPLVAGGRVVVVDRAVAVDPVRLAAVVADTAATVMQATPSTWRLLVESGWSPSRPVRALCGGEPLPPDLARGLLGRVGELWNCYGPTETTIWSTLARVTDPDMITIGAPIANTRVYVLDASRQLVPPGVRGQLWIGGAGVAEGYWNRPELTAARFVPDPLRPGHRMYDTGDIAYWTGQGQLVCLGRSDSQVKLRGHRIELGEIETVLERDAHVSEAVATIREDTPGDQRLVAYLTATPGLNITTLLDHARHHLPTYMVPTTITVLDHIPRTPNNKVDRNQLDGVVVGPGPGQTLGYVAPRSATEVRLAALWQEEFNAEEPLSVEENFFDLGGHSLMALRLFPKVEREFHVKLSFGLLFENLTIASMAAVIAAELSRRDAWDPVVRLRDVGRKNPLFVMPELRGDVLSYRHLLVELDHERPVYGVLCPGLDGRSSAALTIEKLASTCVRAIREVQPQGPYLLAGYCFGGVVAFEVAHQLKGSGVDCSFVGVIDAVPFGRTADGAVRSPSLRWRITSRANFVAKLKTLRGRVRFTRNLVVASAYERVGRRTPVRFVDLTEVNHRASRMYVAPKADVAVTLFQASRGAIASDVLRRQLWEQVAGGGVETKLLTGENLTHLRIVDATHAKVLAAAMNESLLDLP